MRPKILLIEDDEPTIKFYQDVFQLANFDFKTFQWGIKAYDFIANDTKKTGFWTN
jgi:predicted enzyme related to lactoylglutathione lyase